MRMLAPLPAERCCSRICTRLPVAFSAGMTPTIAAATSSRPLASPPSRGFSVIQNGNPPATLRNAASSRSRRKRQDGEARGDREASQDERFDEELSDDAAAGWRRARCARRFPPTRGGARVDEDRDVDEDDDQQHDNRESCRYVQRQRALRIAHAGERERVRLDVGAQMPMRSWRCRGRPLDDGRQFGLRAFERGAGCEPSEYRHGWACAWRVRLGIDPPDGIQ